MFSYFLAAVSLLACATTSEAKKPAAKLEVVRVKRSDGHFLHVGYASEPPPKGSTVGSSMLQTRKKCSEGAKRTAFCSDANDTAWAEVCGHWSALLEQNIIQGGDGICCSAIPEACHSPSSCSVEEGCWVPSCWQEDWYLDNVEFPVKAALEHDSMGARGCFFNSALRECENKDHAKSVTVDNPRLRDYVVSDVYTASEETAAATITSELSSLLEADARHAWQSERVSRLEWRVEPADDRWGKIGVEHSFLLAQAGGNQYRVEQAHLENTYDAEVRLLRDVSPGQVYEVAKSGDLRAGITVGDIVGRFPGGVRWDVLRNNCHQTAQAAFSFAAPGIQEKTLPNAKWMTVLAAVNAVAPTALKTENLETVGLVDAVDSVNAVA